MPRRVTIKDIARHLGISHATVSRALADHPHTSAETKSRVRSTAAKLGYVAHTAARVMRGGQSTLVGLIIPDVQNDFYATVAKAMAETCSDVGHQMVLAITEDDPTNELRHVRALSEAHTAGVVIVPSRSMHRETASLLKRMPVVQLIRKTAALTSDWLGIDDEIGLGEAARHLLELGHRRLGYIGGFQELSTGLARLRGFHRALDEAGPESFAPAVQIGPPRAAFGHQAFRALLAEDPVPTAVVTAGSRITLGALEGIQELGLRVPQDLSLVGFGDPVWFRWWGPGVTTLGLPVRDIAFASGQLLLRRIKEAHDSEGVPAEAAVAATYPAALIIRGSTAAPPGRHRPLLDERLSP